MGRAQDSTGVAYLPNHTKIRNPKHQIPNKLKAPNANDQNAQNKCYYEPLSLCHPGPLSLCHPGPLSLCHYYVYIMASKSRTLYTGVTDDLVQRIFEHKNKLIEGFTKKYNATNLVYYDVTDDVQAALHREKQVKGWLRKKKVALIETINPKWKDLSDGWYKA